MKPYFSTVALLALLNAGCADERSSSGPSQPATPTGALTLLGSLATTRSDGARGFNADIALHRGHAYVGTWGTGSACPGSSVKVVSLADGTNPAQVATLAEYSDTTSEDVVVRSVVTSSFSGDLLAVGLQTCNDNGIAGIDFWDVTSPSAPIYLSTLTVGPAAIVDPRSVPAENRAARVPATTSSGSPEGEEEHLHAEVGGVHELDIEVRGDRVYAYLAVPGGEFSSHQAGMLIVDASDPRQPAIVGSFGAPRDLGHELQPIEYVHSVRVDPGSRTAYLSYWDYGVVLLDVNEPGNPRFLGRTVFGPNAEGNAHSVALAGGGRWLLQCDEDFNPTARDGIEAGQGYLRVFDNADPAGLSQVGSFATPTSRMATPPDGIWSIHNVEVVGDSVYASWYADGVRKLDLSTPSNPREVATYVPPDTPDPFGYWPAKAQVWGVATDGTVVVISDMNAGLYVLRP